MSALQTKGSFYKFLDTKYKLHTQGSGIKIDLDFSKTTLPSIRQGDHAFKIMMKNYFHPRIPYSTQLSLKYEGIIRILSDIARCPKFDSQKIFLRNFLKNLLLQNTILSKSDKERQISYIAYMRNLKKKQMIQMNLFTNQKQTYRLRE